MFYVGRVDQNAPVPFGRDLKSDLFVAACADFRLDVSLLVVPFPFQDKQHFCAFQGFGRDGQCLPRPGQRRSPAPAQQQQQTKQLGVLGGRVYQLQAV